jgi:two-component system, chemotaxis family, chemotaxis protein CheY
LRVLVVDDSRAMRAYVKGVLKEAYDWVVTETSSGFEALRCVARKQYDLVITDINMPDINGIELIRFIKRSDRNQATTIVVISTQSSKMNRTRIQELGVSCFVAKPFEPEELTECITKAMQIDAEQTASDK